MSEEKLTGEIKFKDDGTAEITTENGDLIIINENDGDHSYFNYILQDPAIFDDETRRKYEELPHNERDRFLAELLKEFYRKNPEYAYFMQEQIYKEPLLLLNFFKGASIEHFKSCGINAAKLDELQKRIETAEAAIMEKPIDYSNMKIAQIWPILRIRELFTESELAALYYMQNPRSQSENDSANIFIQRANKIEFPLDKMNHNIWRSLESNTGGQLKIDFKMLTDESDPGAIVLYSIDFNKLGEMGDELKITKKLTPFDKRVYIAVSALYNAGNNIITLSQIYYAMGYVGRPGKPDFEKINNAITKMRRAEIFIGNREDPRATKPNKNSLPYDGSLLPMERVTAYINGKMTEGAIHLFREPPVMTFAKDRKQVTTISLKLLQSPISKTDTNILIDDYLIERIKREKYAKKDGCTILLNTLFEYANIKTSKQKQRAPGKIKKYLNYYKQVELIKSYRLTDEKITIEF